MMTPTKSSRIPLLIKLITLLALTFSISSAVHAQNTLFIEEMTSSEIESAINLGKKTAIIFTGSTEQNGPHMVLGKHNFMAKNLAQKIASELGDALIYPILPFAPTGDPATRSGHMAYPGTIHLREDVYQAVVNDVVISAISSGFKTILIMGDHGDGQKQLSQVSSQIGPLVQPHGIKIFYIDAIYTAITGEHAGLEDTSMLMAIDSNSSWLRKDQFQAKPNNTSSSPLGASVAEGIRLNELRVRAALNQIRQLTKK
jgi:creatinine amidohydrolase/Fe(II)-dependent formamide hydrolase-like protein